MTTKTESALARISHKRIDKVSANVLIVVDKYVPGKMLKHLLDEQYNIVGICTSCQEALKKISEIHPDLILTDVALQDCDGIYFAQQLNLKGENSSLCIYFTEYTSDLIVQQTMIAANKLGCSIISYGSNEHRTNFESRFCEYYGIENRTSLIEELPIQPIRVFLVDDQQIVLWGLEKLIDGERPRMEVVGKSANILDARQLVMEEQPDILIINICLSDMNSVDYIADFSSNGNTRVMIFTDASDKDLIDQAIFNGARGILSRDESPQTILRAIQKIHNGELWLDRMTTGRIFLQSSRIRGKVSVEADIHKASLLTRKECMILKVFSDGTGGEQNKQIAAKLCMSEHTLRNHLTSIFSKLGIRNRFSLFAYAKQHFQQYDNASIVDESMKEH